MFSFLNSAVLFAAAAALIPLIIHLFSRRRRKVVEFSSLRHLKSMQRRQVRRLKVRQLLLLLIRMLIILMIVLAFARPTSRSGAVGSHASVSAAIVFDNSASVSRYVSDGNLFDIAKKRTAQLLEAFGQSDQVCLIPLDKRDLSAASLSFASAAVATERLKQLGPGYGEADLEGGLRIALDMLENASNLNRELYIITDAQRHSLPEEDLLAGTPVSVYFVELPTEDIENLGVVGVDFGGQLIQPNHDFTVTANIRNYGGEPGHDRIASLFLDGNRVAQSDFSIGAGSETEVHFTRSVAGSGLHSGYVEISDDKYMNDNRYYFSFRIPERFTMLIVRGDEASRYISLALMPSLALNQAWTVKEARPDELAGVNFRDYNVIILAGAPELDDIYVERLKNFVRRGRSLFLTYGANTSTTFFNSHFSDMTGVTYDQPHDPNFTRSGYYALASVDIDHPIFSVFSFSSDQPPEIPFYTLPRYHVRDDVRTLMSFSGNRPALVEASYELGRVLTFTGPMGPRFSDITGHAFFVPFISRIAEYLAADLSTLDVRLFSGEQITRSLSLGGSVSYSLEMVAPDANAYSLPPEEQEGALVVRARPTDLPGIYRLRYQGREIDRFAVNISPAENDLSRVDTDQLAVSLGVDDPREIAPGREIEATIAGFRFGRELWQIFLWLAAALVVVEMLLSRGAPAGE